MPPAGITRRPWFAGAIAAAALALLLAPDAASPQARDPHVPASDALPRADDIIVLDDMRLYPEQLSAAAEPPRSRAQAALVDYRMRLGAWDAGVVPYQIDEGFAAIEQQRIVNAMLAWSRVAPVVFVPRTSQVGYLAITREPATPAQASPCFSGVGQPRRGVVVRTNLGGTCANSSRTIAHEIGHAIGMWHEHQRSDRDRYLTIQFDNIADNARGNFTALPSLPLVGEYDFGSIMHYSKAAFAVDSSKPTIVPLPPYASWADRMGAQPDPSDLDHAGVSFLYESQLRESTLRMPTEPVRTQFDRTELLLAMERLHAFYTSRIGLHRPQGLSIDGRPDFVGIAQWIFDIYIAARSGGFSADGAFDIVIATITQSDEWRAKNPGRAPLTPVAYRPYITLDRDEFLDVLGRLDRFYRAPEGLQRPDGLSIAGGPDFLGIAAWIFDIYLSERLRGTSPAAAWVILENAIVATDEWRRKH